MPENIKFRLHLSIIFFSFKIYYFHNKYSFSQGHAFMMNLLEWIKTVDVADVIFYP